MSGGFENLVAFGVIAAACSAAYGWFSDKSKLIKENELNAKLRVQLESDRRALEVMRHDLQMKEKSEEIKRKMHDEKLQRQHTYHLGVLQKTRDEFSANYIQGRKWLAELIAEADKAVDDAISSDLRSKKRPALKAAEEVSIARAERRAAVANAKFLEYQLKTFKEYYPFLEEFEEEILSDTSDVLSLVNLDRTDSENNDPVSSFISLDEYKNLPASERNQRALDRYLNGSLSKYGVGRLYERYLGYLYEQDGWQVDYFGISEGKKDLGRDLICRKGNRIEVVQAKCWSKEKEIHEKHIFQLFGSCYTFRSERSKTDLFAPEISAVFVTSTKLSAVASEFAGLLKICVREEVPLDKSYPMIKCNINSATGERIYHLPFDQQYDRVKINRDEGETYAATVAEAEALGFRRAFRFSGMPTNASR